MFLFVTPVAILLINSLAALLPAFFLLRYIYRQDQVEKEPPRLLFQLFLRGCLAALCALAVELVASQLLDGLVSSERSVYLYLEAFLVIAAVEEGAKLLFLHGRVWNERHFNYRFDGIVYSVFVSLGFAALENIFYVFGSGLSVALPRALLAVPAFAIEHNLMAACFGRNACPFRLNNGERTSVSAVKNIVAEACACLVRHTFNLDFNTSLTCKSKVFRFQNFPSCLTEIKVDIKLSCGGFAHIRRLFMLYILALFQI